MPWKVISFKWLWQPIVHSKQFNPEGGKKGNSDQIKASNSSDPLRFKAWKPFYYILQLYEGYTVWKKIIAHAQFIGNVPILDLETGKNISQ